MADELKAWTPTLRQRSAAALQDLFTQMGMSPYRAMGVAQRFTGGDRSAMGLADFTPVGLLYGAEEAGNQAGQGVAEVQQGDVPGGLLDTALGLGGGALMAAGPVGTLSGKAAAKFGSKAARETALAKKVAKVAAAVADDTAKAPVKAAARVKVAPDVFRTMEKEIGPDATMEVLRKGAHLKPDGRGGFIGGPRTVDSPQALGALRRSLDSQFGDAVEAVKHADPERLGTWYDRAKAAQAYSNEPWQMPRSLDAHAVYSAGVSPESELGFALKHQNSRALGEPTMAYRSAPMNNLDRAVAEDRGAKLGFKIGEYRAKNDPAVPNVGLFGVNDFRAAQGMHYTTPDGKIWKGGVSGTMHPFMDGETALTVDRANRNAVGGRVDWQGPHLQELPWVYGKAQDLYARGSKGSGRFAKMPPEEGMAAALREANNTIGDYFPKHTFGGTFEYAPGKNTGHVPEFFNWPAAVRDQYGAQGNWTRADDGLDKVYAALGLRQLPTRHDVGAYTNSAGEVELNRMSMPRVLASFPTGGGGGRIAPNEAAALNAAERFRGVVDAQEAYAGNLINTMPGVKGKNSLLFETGNGVEGGPWPAPEVLARVNAALDPQGYFMAPNSRGALLAPYNPGASPKALNALLKKNQQLLAEVPGARLPGVASTVYGPAIGKWGDAGVVPSRPFSGEATMGLLEDLATAPAAVSRNISESEEIRQAIRDKIARDAKLGARRDIQNTRAFLSEADWNRAVEMVRAGVKPAAAISALGYSVNSLAAEPDR